MPFTEARSTAVAVSEESNLTVSQNADGALRVASRVTHPRADSVAPARLTVHLARGKVTCGNVRLRPSE